MLRRSRCLGIGDLLPIVHGRSGWARALPRHAAQEMLLPELCRRELTLTCLDNGDVLPVVQLHHLTWCVSQMLV